MNPLRVLEVLTEGCRDLELAKTKFDAIGFNDIVSRIEQIQNEVYERLGLIRETEIKVEEEPEEVETIEPEQSTEEAGDGKEPIIWITEAVGYRYNKESDEFELVRKKPYGVIPFKRFRKSDLQKIWEDLPKRATRIDVEQVARKHGLKIGSVVQYVMRIFTHVLFDGEIKTEGKQLVLVKPDDYNFHEDIRRQLQVERELIDSKGWGK